MPNSGKFAGLRQGFQGLRHLDRFAGGPRSAMQDFLYPWARRDVVYFEDDFLVDTFNTDFWTTNAGTGATAFAVPATPGLGGTIAGSTGTDATAGNRVVNLYGPPIYKGDASAGMAFRVQVSSAANVEFSIGFIDAHTTITTPVVLVGDVDGPSGFAAGLGDAALIHLDTAETLNTLTLVTLGSGALNAGAKDAIGTYLPTAATYFNGRVQLGGDGNTVTAAISEGDGPETVVSRPSAMEGGTLVRPFILISGPTATSKTVTFDLIRVWMDR